MCPPHILYDIARGGVVALGRGSGWTSRLRICQCWMTLSIGAGHVAHAMEMTD